MIKLLLELPSKISTNALEVKSVTLILVIMAVFTLNSCARHSVILGDTIIHGSNEQEIYEPKRQ